MEPPASCWPLWPHTPRSTHEPKDNILASSPLYSQGQTLSPRLSENDPSPDNSNFFLLHGCSLPQVRISKKQKPSAAGRILILGQACSYPTYMQGTDSDRQMTQAQLWRQRCSESASVLLAWGEKLSITASPRSAPLQHRPASASFQTVPA